MSGPRSKYERLQRKSNWDFLNCVLLPYLNHNIFYIGLTDSHLSVPIEERCVKSQTKKVKVSIGHRFLLFQTLMF